jgi:hypothetical protein
VLLLMPMTVRMMRTQHISMRTGRTRRLSTMWG